MPTLHLQVDPERMEEPEAKLALAQAATILREGGTVAFPTETVYGLGANALDENAISKIFKAKERPNWDPLIVHVADKKMLRQLVLGWPESCPPSAEQLMNAFWPGPLTLLLPRSDAVADAVTAGRPLVGVRMPSHPVARELIRLAGVPVAAPSANRFGHTSPTTAQHVLDDLAGRIDAVLDAGPAAVGVESTVVDPNTSPMIVYRPGAVTLEQIRTLAGPVEAFVPIPKLELQPPEALPAPGVGLRHYAPQARLILLPAGAQFTDALRKSLIEFAGEKIGVMLPDWPSGWPTAASTTEIAQSGLAEGKIVVYSWGSWTDTQELASRLFAGLRLLDGAGCSVILCPLPPDSGMGAAIRDRLRKGAIQP